MRSVIGPEDLNRAPQPANEPQCKEEPAYTSDELFNGAREVTITHAGATYRLRITNANKLILTK